MEEEIIRDELGGYLPYMIKDNPYFNPKEKTKFGKGYRRVLPRIVKGRVIGYNFIPFKDYTPEWSKDLQDYNSFEDALKDIYPYTFSDLKILKKIYIMSRVK